ncbi:MAG: hypothetical protein JWQ03_3086 [Variovorax sp.]|nr:hypothetical protein [Variovorax sp.]
MADLFAYPDHPGAKARDTAFAAAEDAAPRAPRLRARAFAIIAKSNGLTADQVAARMGASILSIRPRITELTRLGLIRDCGERRLNASGKKAIVWMAVQPDRLNRKEPS